VLGDDVRADPQAAACASCGAPRRDGEWCPRCLERYDRITAVATESVPFETGAVRAPREYSRTKPSPVTFGLFGRVALSIIPVVVAFFAVRNVMRSRGDPTGAYYIVLAVPTVVIAAGFLAFVWKNERIS